MFFIIFALVSAASIQAADEKPKMHPDAFKFRKNIQAPLPDATTKFKQGDVTIKIPFIKFHEYNPEKGSLKWIATSHNTEFIEEQKRPKKRPLSASDASAERPHKRLKFDSNIKTFDIPETPRKKNGRYPKRKITLFKKGTCEEKCLDSRSLEFVSPPTIHSSQKIVNTDQSQTT